MQLLFPWGHDTKTEALVSEIVDFEFIVTELILEFSSRNQPHQENQPKYNIMLKKDDKSYPLHQNHQ